MTGLKTGTRTGPTAALHESSVVAASIVVCSILPSLQVRFGLTAQVAAKGYKTGTKGVVKGCEVVLQMVNRRRLHACC